MFEHSIRVPRHYKVAANILKKVSTEGGSVKTLLYDNKLRHFRTNVLFALITETIRHAADIDKIFEASEILKNESRLDPWLAKILTTELLFGKKSLPGTSKPEKTILAYKEQFEKYTNEHQADLKTQVLHRPRYVRVNTNLLSTSDAIRSFQDEGYRFIRCTSGSYNDYLQQIKGLTEYEFTQDYHVKTVFVFPHGTKLHEHELYLENQIILQDKATTLAVHLLAPPSGSVVLDMCAAPGMKTTQVAAYMRNQGKVIAVERNEKRFQTLIDFVDKTGCKCVEPVQKDALEIKKGDHDDVEYILLDPSCSGSGMEFTVHNYIEDTRLAKLTSLQEKFLKHAMNAFPNAKRIVYSTCSLFPEENERVITNVVKNSRAKWRVQDVKEMLKGQWNNFGSGMYGSMGTRCLYAKPDSDLTTGFFLAVLDRDLTDLGKATIVAEEINSNKITKDTKEEDRKKKIGSQESNVFETENGENHNRKKKKKQRDKDVVKDNIDITTDITENRAIACEPDVSLSYSKIITTDTKAEESKKKIGSQESNIFETENGENHNKKKKKKQRDKDVIKDNVDITTDIKENRAITCEPDVSLSYNITVSTKKKKRKHEPESVGSNNDNTIEGNESTIVKKKSKKQKIKYNIEEVPTILLINNELVENDKEKHKNKKMKRKKYRERDNSAVEDLEHENNIIVDQSNIQDENINIEYGSKKKKGKRNDIINNS